MQAPANAANAFASYCHHQPDATWAGFAGHFVPSRSMRLMLRAPQSELRGNYRQVDVMPCTLSVPSFANSAQ
jgi:hypothetical protein